MDQVQRINYRIEYRVFFELVRFIANPIGQKQYIYIYIYIHIYIYIYIYIERERERKNDDKYIM